MVRLAGAQGYYGDSPEGVGPLLAAEPDFVICEALAELTLAILQKDRLEDPSLGYAKDLPLYLKAVLPAVAGKPSDTSTGGGSPATHDGPSPGPVRSLAGGGAPERGRTRFITNAGGINPEGAARVAARIAAEMGYPDLVVGCVVGSDFAHRLDEFREATGGFPHLRTGEPCPFESVAFASAYLGAFPIVEALSAGAEVVVTGRVADAALFLGPLLYSYGWARSDHDRLAAGVVVGHLLECSTQVTGGNLSGPWEEVPDPARIAFPLADVEEDGTAVITKAEGGGVVSFETVRQQLLYEVGDPAAYLSPDCVADFTSVRLEDLGGDRVRVTGARGGPPTDSYKALLCRLGGWLGEARLAFSWPDALAKARLAARVLLERASSYLGPDADVWTEFFGAARGGGPGGVLGAASEEDLDELEALPLSEQPSEVIVRVAVRTPDKKVAERFSREANKLGLSGPPGLFGLGRGGGGPSRLLDIWPTLVPKELVDEQVEVRVAKAGELVG